MFKLIENNRNFTQIIFAYYPMWSYSGKNILKTYTPKISADRRENTLKTAQSIKCV